jgi:hypothetical protein
VILLLGLFAWVGVLYGIYGVEPPTLLPPGLHPWPGPRVEAPERVRLEAVESAIHAGTPLLPPGLPGTRTVFPGGLGLGEGGTPLVVAPSPGGRGFGLHVQAPSPREGGWTDGDTLVTHPISLEGLPSTHTYALSLPTEELLVVSVRTRSEGGVAARALHEVALTRPIRIVTLTHDLHYTHAEWSRPGGPSLVLWGEGRRWLGINREVPRTTHLRVYPRGPHGAGSGFNAVRIPALAGQVVRGGWYDDGAFVFVTARSFGPRARRGERHWALTLLPGSPTHPSKELEP